jgi:hypothetical protein
MKRRTWIQSLLAAAAGSAAMQAAEKPAHGIQLNVDLAVDPAKEKEMLHTFHNVFLPEAVKHTGYIDATMLKFRTAPQGSAPAAMNYRFCLTYQSEELRQKWVASPEHKKVGPMIEKTLSSPNYTVLLFDLS